jgi:hypothetical protein
VASSHPALLIGRYPMVLGAPIGGDLLAGFHEDLHLSDPDAQPSKLKPVRSAAAV